MEERIKNMIAMIESGDIEGFLNDIDQMGASRAYIVIRDHINQHHVKAIKESGNDNYQKFQDIKIRAKESWDYDHRQATMSDVNLACMNVYTLVLRLMKAQSVQLVDDFTEVMSAINRIEEKVGLPITSWVDNKSNDIDGGKIDVNNVQGVEENI